MADADLVIDALDNVPSRLILEDAAAEAGLTIIHGAICGWELQAMLVPPGSGLLHQIYTDVHMPVSKTSLSFTPAACAAIEVSMAIKYLCDPEAEPEKRLLAGALDDMNFEIIHFR